MQFPVCNAVMQTVYTPHFPLCSHIKEKNNEEPKEIQGMEVAGATMSPPTSLFRMQIISEFLISINAWGALNAFNFQSRQAEE